MLDSIYVFRCVECFGSFNQHPYEAFDFCPVDLTARAFAFEITEPNPIPYRLGRNAKYFGGSTEAIKSSPTCVECFENFIRPLRYFICARSTFPGQSWLSHLGHFFGDLFQVVAAVNDAGVEEHGGFLPGRYGSRGSYRLFCNSLFCHTARVGNRGGDVKAGRAMGNSRIHLERTQ